MKKTDLTWQEVLMNKGFDHSTSKSLIGFIAWKENEIFSRLGEEINDVLCGYEGKVIAKDVISNKYNNKGLLFVNNHISNDLSNKIFEEILDYEHEEVYDL
ncbi:hypothetical protein [Crassaminicella profunda]|uniref:hypothetical protein n=1 Tax=Crassaminicella profunda TaxID=1286698 RepID=UPI001CA6B25B|nr:hypothetical protein [Crassaminicella profunda]QZY57286.1 hypothetical protein K7H06_10350 [Crassaminicella profunda]